MSVIQTILEQGSVTAELKNSFPAHSITSPDNYVSLLYYFGMLTIGGLDELGDIRFVIPNQVERQQMYKYLLDIIEFKYAKSKDSAKKVEDLTVDARKQVMAYSATSDVKRLMDGTLVHRLVVVFRGMKMEVCAEV